MKIFRALIFFLLIIISHVNYSQEMYSIKKPDTYFQKKKENGLKGFSISSTMGYINIPSPNLGNNVWVSGNLGYSKKNWNFVFWTGANYWIEGRQPDLRLGISTTYTWFKW